MVVVALVEGDPVVTAVVVGVAVLVFVTFYTTPEFAYGQITGIGSGVPLGQTDKQPPTSNFISLQSGRYN